MITFGEFISLHPDLILVYAMTFIAVIILRLACPESIKNFVFGSIIMFMVIITVMILYMIK